MKTIELNKAQQLVAEGMLLSDADRQTLQQECLHELVDYVRQHSPVLEGLSQHIQAFFIENDTPGARVTWSNEPFIPNKQGGKTPVYIKIE